MTAGLLVAGTGAVVPSQAEPAATSYAAPKPPPPIRASDNNFRTPAPESSAPRPPIAAEGRRSCGVGEVDGRAFTRRGPRGVLGVVQVRGAFIKKGPGRGSRCALHFRRGPLVLRDAQGRGLGVRTSSGNLVTPATNDDQRVRETAFAAGTGAIGFAWTGSWCGPRAAQVVVYETHLRRNLVLPLTGPAPACRQAEGSDAVLVRGLLGAPGDAVQPAPDDYRRLTVDGQFFQDSTSSRASSVDLTITNTGEVPIALDPCPRIGAVLEGRTRDGEFSIGYRSRYLRCVDRTLVLAPGEATSYTLPAVSLRGAKVGSELTVRVGLAGTRRLELTTPVTPD